MKCPKCHFENPVNTVYCSMCRTKFDSAAQISFTKILDITIDGLTQGTVFAGR